MIQIEIIDVSRHILRHTCDIPTSANTRPHSMVVWHELVPHSLELKRTAMHKELHGEWIFCLKMYLDESVQIYKIQKFQQNIATTVYWRTGNLILKNPRESSRMKPLTKILATLSIFFVFLKVRIFLVYLTAKTASFYMHSWNS